MMNNRKVDIDPRTVYAAERTMLAWIRTGLALMGFGFVVARFSLLLKQLVIANHTTMTETPGLSLWIGTVLVVLGVAVCLLASRQYGQEITRLQSGKMLELTKWTMGRVVSIILAIIGLTMAAYLIRLGA